MLEARTMLFVCAFILLTVPFVFTATKAATLIAQIDQQVAQIAKIE